MRKNCILIYMIVLFLLFCGCSGETISTEKGERVFGSFSTADMAGNLVNEEIFSGHKLTMVNIWATFCNPCAEEMPDLAQLQAQYGDEFQVIGIVLDAADKNGNILPDKKAEAASIIETTEAYYLHLLPSNSLNKAYLNEVQSVPVTIFVDENGNQIGARYFGAKNKTEWKKIIDTLLESL